MGVSPTHGPGMNCQWSRGRVGAARRRSQGHGPATRRPALVGRLPIDRAGQVCWADKPNWKTSTALERSGGAGVRFILDPAHPAGSQLTSIAAVVDVSGRDGREMASGLLLSCFWKDERRRIAGLAFPQRKLRQAEKRFPRGSLRFSACAAPSFDPLGHLHRNKEKPKWHITLSPSP